MQNLKYFCLFFALLAFTARCDESDPVWVNKSFSIVPNIFITSEILPIPPLTIVINLQSGPAPMTNLFSLGHKVGQNETNDISILNTTALSSIREFFDIGSLYPLETVAIVSLPGSIFYTAVVKDKSGFNQIYGFPMGANDYFPEEVAMTKSTDKATNFKVHQLLAAGFDVIAIYVESKKDNHTMYVAKVGVQAKKVDKLITITSGNLSNIFCDWENSTNSVLCIYKDSDTIYRALVALNDQNAEPKILSLTTDSDSSYIPQMVVATKGYFAYFINRQKESATDLLGLVFDGTSNLDTAKDISTVKPLRSFKNKDYYPLAGALSYADGVVAFYRDMDSKGDQSWYYSIYNKDMTIKGDEVKLADVPGARSGFKVAKEMGAGAINIMAFTYTSWHGAVVVNLFYGQIFGTSL